MPRNLFTAAVAEGRFVVVPMTTPDGRVAVAASVLAVTATAEVVTEELPLV